MSGYCSPISERPRWHSKGFLYWLWSFLTACSVAKDRGRISINPCERGGRLYESGERADKIWSESAIVQLMGAASDRLIDALMLALWSGQREGDLLALPWSAYDGT